MALCALLGTNLFGSERVGNVGIKLDRALSLSRMLRTEVAVDTYIIWFEYHGKTAPGGYECRTRYPFALRHEIKNLLVNWHFILITSLGLVSVASIRFISALACAPFRSTPRL